MEGPDSASARAYAAAPLPDGATPWRQASFSVVDLELTGLDPERNEIISFAAVPVEGGRVRLADALYRVVRPRHMPDGETIRIHGLRETDLINAPPLSEVFDELLRALTGTILVAHVAAIETGFLRSALRSDGLTLRNPVVDTAALARAYQTGQGRPRRGREPIALSDLARSLGLPVHRPHHAEGDALTTAQVFLALATHLEGEEAQTVSSLQRAREAGRRSGGLRDLLRRLARP